MSDSSKPTVVGNYRIIERISEGSSGIVYLAEADGERYALKLLKASDADTLVRFRKESSTLARLRHENLLRIHDVSEHEGSPYMVMELLEGHTLADEIAKRGTIGEAEAVAMVSRIIDALSEIHKNALVHRDVKPANVFVTTNGAIRLIDLGLIGSIDKLANETSLVGTPLYCAPEQSKILRRDVDGRSDLYSTGVVLFEALTGRPPFVGSTVEILQQHASRVAPDVRELCPSASAAVAALLSKLLAKDPDDRYQSTFGLLHDLKRLEEIEKSLRDGSDPNLGSKDQSRAAGGKVKFVARETETTRLRGAWSDLQAGQPGLVVVSGPSGSGKTRLTEEFLDEIRSPEVLILRTKCQFFDRELPFGPVREAFDGLIEDLASLPEEERKQAYEKLRLSARGLEPQLLKLTKSFAKILPEYSAGESKDLEGDRERFFSALADFVIALGRTWGTLVFFLDDLQWIDVPSRQLFEKTFREANGKTVFMLSTARDDGESLGYLAPTEESLGAHIREKIAVAPFTAEQIASLIRDYLNAPQLNEEIPRAILAKSRGNAFVALEYLRAGLEQGFLLLEKGEWTLDRGALDQIALADNVFDIILKRVEASSLETKSFLQRAAFYGNVFRANEISRIFDMAPEFADTHTRIASELGLIERVSEAKWKFAHDKILESLMSELDKASVQQVSERIALWLQAKTESSPAEIFTAARLFARTDVTRHMGKAILSQARAGHEAFRNFAYGEAYRYLKTAYTWIDESGEGRDELASLSPALAVCSTMIGDEALASECIDRHVALAATREERAEALALKVWIMNVQSRPVHAWEYFRQVCDLVGSPHPQYLQWKVLKLVWYWALSLFADCTGLRVPQRFLFRSSKIDINVISNMFRDAVYTCELRNTHLDLLLVSIKMLVIGQLAGGAKTRALGHACVGNTYGSYGLKQLAIHHFSKASDLCATLADPSLNAYCEMRRVLGLFFCGVIKDYGKEYAAKKQLFDKYLAPAEHGRLLVYNGFYFSYRGLHRESMEIFREGIESFERNTVRVAPHSVVVMLNQLWCQYEILGFAQEAQKTKALALAKNFELRHCPPIVRSLLNAEICSTRVTERIENRTEEIMAGYWKRRGNKIADPPNNNVTALMTYLRLDQFKKATTVEEKFSTRREFRTMMRFLFSILYCPLYRANYHFLRGSYYRSVNKMTLASHHLDKAQSMAAESGNLRVLFDCEREKARSFRDRGHIELMKMSLSAAVNLASKHGWKTSLDLLLNEFEEHVETAQSSASGSSSQTSSGSRIASRTLMGSAARSQLGGRQSRTMVGASTSMGASIEGQSGINQERFTRILLDVTRSFIGSVDFAEQSKAVLSQIVRLFAAQRGFVFLRDDSGGEAQIVAGLDAEGFELQSLKGYSGTVVNRALNEGKPVIVTGTDAGEALGSESVVVHNLRSIMATPLMIEERVIGAVYLDSTLTKGLFTNDDVELFSTLANHISVAFELSRITKLEVEKANAQRELAVQSVIATESKKVKVLVDNMQQALFSVDRDGLIVEPVSRYSEKLFGGSVAGRDVRETLYRDLASDREKFDGVASAINTVFGEDDLQWDLAESGFPRKVPFEKDEQRKTLKVSPAPIFDEQSLVERVLFVVEDVTELEALEGKVKANEEQLKVMECILANDLEELGEALAGLGKLLTNCRAALDSADLALRMPEVLRDLHTLKGNARLMKMSLLSDRVHGAETDVLAQRTDDKWADSLRDVMATELDGIASVLERHQALFGKFFKTDSGEGSGRVNAALMRELEAIVTTSVGASSAEILSKLRTWLRRSSAKSIAELAKKFEPMVTEIAGRLEKKVAFAVSGEALAESQTVSALQQCLLHLIRNSLDHAIELPAERMAAGKSESGSIEVRLIEDEGGVTVTIVDDGKGIDVNAVAAKAVAKSLIGAERVAKMDDREKLNLIFLPGFSTKEAVSELSGRGIGMDVVKHNVQDLGGEIELATVFGKGSTFVIRLHAAAKRLRAVGE